MKYFYLQHLHLILPFSYSTYNQLQAGCVFLSDEICQSKNMYFKLALGYLCSNWNCYPIGLICATTTIFKLADI